MADDAIALVVGASVEEFAHVKQCLSDWGTVNASLSEKETANLIIVYARKDEESTLAICEQLRNSPENSSASILLVIGRYEFQQGSAVRRMGNATFIISPFGEKELRDKIAELLEGS